MAANYWIKLYHEILDDPKMGRLSDSTWRLCIELFLLAGEQGNDGRLPSDADIMWRIRRDDIAADLERLQAANILSRVDGNLVVTHFATRQSAVPADERKRQQRERDRRGQYYDTSASQPSHEPVTNRTTDKIRIDTDIETDTEKSIGPDATAPERKRAPKRPPEPLPPAVEIFRHEMGRNPAKQMYGDIQQIVGEQPDDLQFWARVIHSWIARGYNPKNISGMLQFYRRRELPTDGKAGTSHSDPIADYNELAAREGWTDGNQR